MMFLSCCRKGKYLWICFASVRWLAPHRHCLQKSTSNVPPFSERQRSYLVGLKVSWYSEYPSDTPLCCHQDTGFMNWYFPSCLGCVIANSCSWLSFTCCWSCSHAHFSGCYLWWFQHLLVSYSLTRASTHLSAFIARKSTRGLLDVSALKMYLFRITSPEYIHSRSRSFCIWTLLCSYIQSPCSMPLLLHILVLRFLSWIPVFQNDASSFWLLE